MKNIIGEPIARREGPLKVTGRAQYSAELAPQHALYAIAVGSPVASGTIRSIDATAARQLPGIVSIITHENRPHLHEPGKMATGSAKTEARLPLNDNKILYAGQYVAVVVADTLEHAQHAAEMLKIDIDAIPPVISWDDKRATRYEPQQNFGLPVKKSRGSAREALEQSPVKVDHVYSTQDQNHNPMELHSTVASWDGDKLTLHDASQYPAGVVSALAPMFNIPEENVRVVSTFVGGAFGGKGAMWHHVPLATIAARVAGRPVKLVLNRHQEFFNVGRRTATKQRIALGAERDGQLKAIIHEGTSDTSMDGEFVEQFTIPTPMLYQCPNVSVGQELVRINRMIPTFMRAPGEATGVWSLECAMDELAIELGMDPIALRMKNYAREDQDRKKPFSSKSLDRCYTLGAEKIGWERRIAEPGRRRDGDYLVGLGMATATRAAKHFNSAMSARLNKDGTFLFRSSTPEQGTGSYTVLPQIAADALSVPINSVEFLLGDTNFAKAPIAAGSATITTVGNAVWGAAKQLQKEIASQLIKQAGSPYENLSESDLHFQDGTIVCPRKNLPALTYRDAMRLLGKDNVEIKYHTNFEDEKSPVAMHGFGAQFAEVRIDPDIGRLIVSRFVSVVTCGRVMNMRTCKAQVEGSVVWGISFALMEKSIVDHRNGRVMNADLAEYHIPVNADIHSVEVHLIEEEDPDMGPLGAKGVGEIGITGVQAAICNAVYNACGKRVRDLPITVDKLI